MTCPHCKCPECAKAELNAVLSRRLARETSVEWRNAEAIQLATDQSAWRDTIGDVGCTDPHPDQLARDVVRDMGRGG